MTTREIILALFLMKYLCLVVVVYCADVLLIRILGGSGGLREWR